MAYEQDELRLNGVMSRGYGVMPKSVMQDSRLTIEAKAIYAYIASFAGAGTTAFPGKKKIAEDLRISEERLYTHRKLLIKYGYITVHQERGPGGTLGKTVYTLEAIAIERPDEDKPSTDKPCAEKPCSEKPRAENPSYNNNNSLKNNNISKNNKENNNKVKAPSPSEFKDLYHATCPSLPKIVKMTSGRIVAYRERLKEYSLDDIKRALTLAENSDFLKGKNDRGWTANFDWLMKPANMAKVLEGNYNNKTKAGNTPTNNIEEEETL